MAGVRRHRLDRLLVAVEAQIVGALLLPPEPFVELFEQAGGPVAELGGPLRLAPDLIRLGHPEQSIKGITLQLAERVGKRCDAAILMPDRIVRVLPALAVETARRAR